MGLVFFGAMFFYLIIAVVVVRWAIRYAQKNEKSTKLWGICAALIMYLIPFWDWIPTVVTHKYFCSTKAGIWTYKTVDEWKAENPGIAETLISNTAAIQRAGDVENYTDTQILNQRFYWENKKERLMNILPVYRLESIVVDSLTGDAVVRNINYSSGTGAGYMKIWLNKSGCENDSTNRKYLYQFVESIINISGKM